VEACAKRCADLSDCKAFDYHNPGSFYGRRCYLWTAGQVYPLQSLGYEGNAGVCKAIEWRPILGCPNAINANSANLAITPYSSDAGSQLGTKPFTGDENQMWRIDNQNRLVNKETGLVMYANFGSPRMEPPSPLREAMQWEYKVDSLFKIVNGERCLNLASANSEDGSYIIMWPVNDANRDNSCWTF